MVRLFVKHVERTKDKLQKFSEPERPFTVALQSNSSSSSSSRGGGGGGGGGVVFHVGNSEFSHSYEYTMINIFQVSHILLTYLTELTAKYEKRGKYLPYCTR